MSDAALVWFPFGADININNGDLSADNGLATAVMISLFTDARAPDLTLLPAGENDVRGWWGDIEEFKTRISEIAYSLGFIDLKYFRKLFKLKFNVTPSNFRKENIGLKDEN